MKMVGKNRPYVFTGLSVGWHLAGALTVFLIICHEDIHERGLPEKLQKVIVTMDKCVQRRGEILRRINGNLFFTVTNF